MLDASSSSEAILFFDDNLIVKEMTCAEFQAILDNYVPLHDIANCSMNAVYVRINDKLNVTGAVFFVIGFDQQSFVEKSWNIPLQQLADNAAKGPDLGSGGILWRVIVSALLNGIKAVSGILQWRQA